MQYYDLKSLVASQKQPVPLKSALDSFLVATQRSAPYIEPTFTKEEYPTERPAILLVSAVGASGKTTTARALAHDAGLPVLDLAKHKPVGDNTLTGVLTTAYPIELVGAVLEGLRSGTHGIIIDGIDEGRSKTTEQAFDAFLDDIVERSKGAIAPSIVVFGRSQVLLSTWFYLAEKGANVCLVRIDPFSVEQAKLYIDEYVPERDASQEPMYKQARDVVLRKLGAAFAPSGEGDHAFLDFIGYPPVLDAIATLLRTERNYHRVSQALSADSNGDLEVRLLIQIADFLLKRERDEKALPNFISDILSKADANLTQQLGETLYNGDEQCARVLARALHQDFPRSIISDVALNNEYEKALTTWCPEHPFLDDTRVRNAVFEAVAVARCALSAFPEYQDLALTYTARNRPTYHFLYIMAQLASGVDISGRYFNMLIQSCSDFMGNGHEIGIEINGLSWDEPNPPAQSTAELEVAVSIPAENQKRTFKFQGTVSRTENLLLGPFLANVTVTLPCDVYLQGQPTLECVGVCRISAKKARFDTSELIVRGFPNATATTESGLFLDAEEASGHVSVVTAKGSAIEVACSVHNLTFPLAKYVRRMERPSASSDVAGKYRRLRRIMSEFASHSKGGLAKYRAKIEHERVLRGSLGASVLKQLLEEGVLYTDAKFYYVDSDKLSRALGTTWQELRQYKLSKPLEAFLKRVSDGGG